jgi:hypothetical protein
MLLWTEMSLLEEIDLIVRKFPTKFRAGKLDREIPLDVPAFNSDIAEVNRGL